jgi:hypothetical protein
MASPHPPLSSQHAHVTPPPGVVGSPARPPHRWRWLRVAAAAAVVVAAMAAGAAVTYGMVSHSNAPTEKTVPSTSPPAPPIYSAAERSAAKQHVCEIFDASARGGKGKGGVITDGELNIPVVLRKLGSVVAVENALAPATPIEVAEAAHKYVDMALQLITAAMQSDASIDELSRLTVAGNDATYAFADVCGLKH